MKRCRRWTWLLLAAIALTVQLALAEGPASSVKLNQVRQRGADLTMYVNLSDASGNPAAGEASAESFDAQVGDVVLDVDQLQHFDAETMGIHYVFCVDVSASLTKAMMGSVQEELCRFVEELGPTDAVSLITFGTTVETVLLNSSDRQAIEEAIHATEARDDSTALFKGVLDGVDAAARVGGRSAVIVITDGKNDVEKAGAELQQYTKESIYENVQSAQVPLYCIGLTDKGGVDSQSLAELVAATGGSKYELPAAQIGESLGRVRDIMRSTLVLHARLVNAEGKTGINSVETFQVSYTPADGSSMISNALQQAVNWSRVPAPEYTPEPTAVPSISLSLDATQLEPGPDGSAAITGMIEVNEGSVAAEELGIYVNGEPWEASLMRNGNGYVFSAEGAVSGSAGEIEVQARCAGIASGIQRMEVAGPTPEPSATPGPSLTVTLDEAGGERMSIPGETMEISGVIDVQGQIDPADLTLFVNDAECEMRVEQLNANQYGFSAEHRVRAGDPAELNVQVRLKGAGIASPRQRVPLVTPSPTPAPELSISLDRPELEYAEGEVATIRGVLYVEGAIDPEDLAFYVEGVRWSDLSVEPRDDGSYHFEARNTLIGGDIEQLEMRMKLLSDSKIGSNTLEVAAHTLEPVATPTPTPRPRVTPPPTEAATEAPETEPPEEAGEGEGLDAEPGGGLPWYLPAAALLVLIAAVALAVRASRRRKPKIERTDGENGFKRNHRGGGSGGETRRDDGSSAPETVRSDEANPGVRRPRPEAPRPPEGAPGSGKTRRIDADGGTRRIDGDGKTRRLDDAAPQMELLVEETRGGQPQPERNLRLSKGESLTFGRSSAGEADVLLRDDAITARHLSISFDGDRLYVTDLNSTNGTKRNGERLAPNARSPLQSGDTLLLGETALKFSVFYR